jgi:hypothetical protein
MPSAAAASMAVLAISALLAAGCASSAPHQFGQYQELGPKVAATPGERLPQHIKVQLDRPANVAVFLVTPGRPTTLLFPSDSTESGHMESGSHLVATSLAGVSLGDTTRLTRRPTQGGRGGRMPNQGQRGGVPSGRDTLPAFGFNQHGYLLIFAAQQPLPYKTLATRVAGLSVPIDDDDAINTVTKLVRERTALTGSWAAYSTDFPP